jgi:hypothetical protein
MQSLSGALQLDAQRGKLLLERSHRLGMLQILVGPLA